MAQDTAKIKHGKHLMTQALFLQKKYNSFRAASFLERHGISYELAMYALRGSKNYK